MNLCASLTRTRGVVYKKHEEGKGGGKERMNFGITVRKLKEEYIGLYHPSLLFENNIN